MKSWKKPTDEMIEKAIVSVKKETDRRYFFSRLKNPLWIQPLNERGYFSSPPGIMDRGDGYLRFPSWPELLYLKNVAQHCPDEVTDIILHLPATQNPSIYTDILEIVLKFSGEQSSKLKPKIFECVSLKFQPLPPLYHQLLVHWVEEEQFDAALELTKELIKFVKDPRAKEKNILHEKNPRDPQSRLEPTPRFDIWDYQEILEKGVRPLAAKRPLESALMLIDLAVDMNNLHFRSVEENQREEKYCWMVWCRRLNQSKGEDESSEQALIHTLNYACEMVYEKSSEHVIELDAELNRQEWSVIKRLQKRLYALHPNDRTKPWIRELILSHPDYAKSEYHYEFQQMVRNACEHFGEELLTKEERTKIFDAIMDGPSKTAFRDWLGDRFTEELFQERQKKFHQKQFRLFAAVLFGGYAAYYRQLNTELNESISDEDYSPVGEIESGMSYRSPKSSRDLANLRDEELLDYINEWQGEHDIELDWTGEVSIGALSGAFQKVFMEAIIPNKNRLNFWLKNRDRIQRPVYIRTMIDAMLENVKAKKFEQIDRWLDFCQWVLSHPDAKTTDTFPFGEESREKPNWTTSRRSVVDFVKICLDQDVNVSISARSGLANILRALCTQPDWTLDQENHAFRDDLVDVAINRTRGRAIDSLMDFGSWVRRHDSDSDVPEIAAILNFRFSHAVTLPLTLPEYAILGFHYHRIAFLDLIWAKKRKADIFPHENLPAWRAAFSAVIRYVRVGGELYRHLQDEYRFAVEHLDKLSPKGHEQENRRNEIIDKLGHHLFIYYLWGMFPLKADESILNLFYEKTRGNPKHWGSLFDYAGHQLKLYGESWERDMITKAMKFFDWRLSEQTPEELQEFLDWWIEAECLPAEWRLDAFSRVLGICQPGVRRVMHGVSALVEMLEEHPEKALKCFAKMTDLLPADDHVYIDTDKAKTILKFGLNSGDQNTRRHAEHARENLLRHGYFDFLQLDGQ